MDIRDSIGSAADHAGAARNPVVMCTVQGPLVSVDKFSHTDPPEKTNEISYFAEAGERKIPFKFLRSGPGRRPVVVFLHGMGLTTASYWGMLAYTMRSHDVLLIDWSDFATGDYWPRRGLSLERLAADFLAVPHALGIDRFVLSGSSLGGGLSLMTAIGHPSLVTGLMLFNPAAYPQSLPMFYQIARIPLLGEFIMRTVGSRSLTYGVFKTGYADPRKAHPDLVKMYEINMRPLANRLKLMHLIRALPTRHSHVARYADLARHIDQPVMVVWGVKDGLLHGATPNRLQKDIQGLQLEMVDHVSHLPHEEAPERVGPMVAEFLQQRMMASANPQGN